MTDGGLLKAVLETARRTKMFPRGAKVLAAVSGGPDSTAMLSALVRLKDRLGIGEIGVAHVNHGLRGGASDRDAAFAEELARKEGLAFFLEKTSASDLAAENGLCLEEAGRTARYDFFGRVCAEERFSRVAVAHTADDNAETVLMFLLRGAAGTGLSGIPAIRGNIVRPFLEATRKDVLDFLKDQNLPFVTDESNSDPSFMRNRIRGELLPLLEKDYNPAVVAALNRLADVLGAEESFWEGFISRRMTLMGVSPKDAEISFSAAELKAEHPAVRRRLVRAAIERAKGDLRRIGLVHVEDVLSLKTGKTAHLPGGVVAKRTRESLIISKPADFTARPKTRG